MGLCDKGWGYRLWATKRFGGNNLACDVFYSSIYVLTIMKILKHLRSDWFRYGFETLAVVVGILIAFALDNWNEHRKEDNLEIQYLNGMLSEVLYLVI